MSVGHGKVILPENCVSRPLTQRNQLIIGMLQKLLSQPPSGLHQHVPPKPVPMSHGRERGLLARWPPSELVSGPLAFSLPASLTPMHSEWHDSAGGVHAAEKENGKLQVKTPPHLTGAPRDWAGFSITVMVVSVSFSGVSVSYSGIDGARRRTEREGGWAQDPSPSSPPLHASPKDTQDA